MKQDTMPQVAQFWNETAADFDAIHTGRKSAAGRMLDRRFRKDISQRFDWVMKEAGNVGGKTICNIGRGSGRFVAELGRRGAARITGVDVAPDMLNVAGDVVKQAGVADRCDFVLSDVLDFAAARPYDISVVIGFWDYIMHPAERLRVIRGITSEMFLSAWPRFWTWRMPVFRRQQIYNLLEDARFKVESCQVVGKLFCVKAGPV